MGLADTKSKYSSIRAYPEEPDHGKSKRRPKDELKVSMLLRHLRGLRVTKAVLRRDSQSERGVTEHPERDETGAECFVLILQESKRHLISHTEGIKQVGKLRTSIVGISFASATNMGATARVTVSLNAASMSS